MSQHWWPEGWRLFAAALPHLSRGRRRMIVVVVAAAGAILGAVLALVVGDGISASVIFSLLIAGLTVSTCLLVDGDPIFPVALIVLGLLVVVGFFTIVAELYLLGSTTATLDAEARAVAREAGESGR